MISYAGIGSRQITDIETSTIMEIAKRLSKNFIVYSGHANGSDLSFEYGSNGKCVLFLPWNGFNNKYELKCIKSFNMGNSIKGLESIEKFHPNVKALNRINCGRKFMARNYHQIMGTGEYPTVSFVICCANRSECGKILGGTAFACSIASSLNIPIINIRDPFYDIELEEIISKFK